MLESVVIVIALLVIVLLAFSDKFPFLRRSNNTGAALRELLLARASGSISAEEFETRQSLLHAELLATPQDNTKPWLLWGLPIILALIAISAYFIFSKRDEAAATPKSTLPPFTLQNSAMPSTALPKAAPSNLALSNSNLPNSTLPNAAPAPKQSSRGGDLKLMVTRLASKLAQDPKNGESWALLAHTHTQLGQFNEAEAAFAKAGALLAPDAKLFADWADAHVMGNSGKWDTQARDLVKRALSTDPKNLKAMALAGSEAFARADYPQAIAHWKDMQAAAPANSMHAKLAQVNIDEANAMLAGKKPGKP